MEIISCLSCSVKKNPPTSIPTGKCKFRKKRESLLKQIPLSQLSRNLCYQLLTYGCCGASLSWKIFSVASSLTWQWKQELCNLDANEALWVMTVTVSDSSGMTQVHHWQKRCLCIHTIGRLDLVGPAHRNRGSCTETHLSKAHNNRSFNL